MCYDDIQITRDLKEQWKLLKERVPDRNKLDRTYVDWEKNRDQAIAILRNIDLFAPILNTKRNVKLVVNNG